MVFVTFPQIPEFGRLLRRLSRTRNRIRRFVAQIFFSFFRVRNTAIRRSITIINRNPTLN